jgi:hypothetical protein
VAGPAAKGSNLNPSDRGRVLQRGIVSYVYDCPLVVPELALRRRIGLAQSRYG